MLSGELLSKYNTLSVQAKKEFDAKMDEYAANLLRGGPYDISHWPKVPPSPAVAVSGTSTTESALEAAIRKARGF